MVKNPSAMQETQGQSLGGEDSLEKGIATLLEAPGRLQSIGSQRVGHNRSDLVYMHG